MAKAARISRPRTGTRIGTVVKIRSPGIGQGKWAVVNACRRSWVTAILYNGTVVKRKWKNVWIPRQPELFEKDSEGHFLSPGDTVKITSTMFAQCGEEGTIEWVGNGCVGFKAVHRQVTQSLIASTITLVTTGE